MHTAWSDADRAMALQIDGETVGTVVRTTSSEIHRYRAYARQPGSATPLLRPPCSASGNGP
jgi:hypothetical protein